MGNGRRPAVILWGGSEGALGQTPELAALFASRGIPALAIAYFDEPGLLPSAAAARIPIERFKGPVLLISGGSDQLWPSNLFADRIMDALRGDPADHVHLNYPAAGHLVLGLAYAPAPTEESAVGPLGRSYRLNLGGSEGADAAARARDWPAILRFIASN